MIRNVVERGFRLGITEQDAIMMYLPLFHLFGFSEGMLMSLVTGARQVLTETFDPDECLDLIASERATIIHGFDTHYKELLEAQERQPRDLSSVRTGIFATGMSSSIPIAPPGPQAVRPLVSGYGMSEFGVGAAIGSLDSTEEQCVEASGYPGSGYEVRIIDPETGRDQPVAVPGEILVRGYIVMRGYYKQARGDGAGHRRRRLVAHRRHGPAARRRPHAVPGPLQGHAQDRRRERRSDGGRGLLMSHPAVNAGRGGRAARRAAQRGGVAFVRCEPGPRSPSRT